MALELSEARAPAPPVEDEPHYHGHRDRLRQRFLDTSGEGMPDYEMLELLLFRAIPRRDVKPLAKAVLKHFGSFAEAVHASRERLAEVPGLGQAAITEIKIVQEAARRFLQRDLERKPLLNSWGQVCDYLRATMAFDTNEQFRILFLDKRNRLIADEMQQRGTVDHTSVYVREVVKRALELSATAIVLSHNHPSGDPTPSPADIKMTKDIIDAASKVGVLVHDHVIVGKDGHLSLRQAELI